MAFYKELLNFGRLLLSLTTYSLRVFDAFIYGVSLLVHAILGFKIFSKTTNFSLNASFPILETKSLSGFKYTEFWRKSSRNSNYLSGRWIL